MKKIMIIVIMMSIFSGCIMSPISENQSNNYSDFIANTNVILSGMYRPEVGYSHPQYRFYPDHFTVTDSNRRTRTYYCPLESDPSAYFVVENWYHIPW